LGTPVVVGKAPRYPGKAVYTGPLQACILDWSGTTADAHVIAPAVVFVDVFNKHGVPITMKEARVPMGLRKDLHIAQILEMPDVRKRWTKAKGAEPTKADVDTIFADFVPMQVACLAKYAVLLPGAKKATEVLKKELNLVIGHTTGFTKSMVEVLAENTIKQGYTPDFNCAGDMVENGMGFRPTPFMIYKNLVNLKIWPIESVVKVDDTVTGVQEGITAGCWSVGVAGISNYTDIDTMEQWDAMDVEERTRRVKVSFEKLHNSGAHYVTDSIREVPWICKDINERLARGETPQGSTEQVRLTNEITESNGLLKTKNGRVVSA